MDGFLRSPRAWPGGETSSRPLRLGVFAGSLRFPRALSGVSLIVAVEALLLWLWGLPLPREILAAELKPGAFFADSGRRQARASVRARDDRFGPEAVVEGTTSELRGGFGLSWSGGRSARFRGSGGFGFRERGGGWPRFWGERGSVPLDAQGRPVVLISSPFFCFPHGLGFPSREEFFAHLFSVHRLSEERALAGSHWVGGKLFFFGF
jgi:hypothetical protein